MKKNYCLSIITFLGIVLNLHSQNNRIWGTYYGSIVEEEAMAITADKNGNIYLVGEVTNSNSSNVNNIITTSNGFQTTYGGGIGDGLIVKFDSNGNRIWATFYGGTGRDVINCITTDNMGNIYVAGKTDSPNNIATPGALYSTLNLNSISCSFIAKFDANGNRIWATYYRSNNAGQHSSISDIAYDNNGNIIFSETKQILGSGNVYSLIKFSTSGNLQWIKTNNNLIGADIACDLSGNIYFVGLVYTSNIFSGVNGFQLNYGGGSFDGYLTKYNPSGNMIWGTYYGGSGSDWANGVTCDSKGNIYITGTTHSYNNIAFNGYQNTKGITQDAFLVKFDSIGNRIWATYYGGSASDGGNNGIGVQTDINGNVYLLGDTYSAIGIAFNGFQNTPSIYANCPSGGAFLATFNDLGTRLCATYIEYDFVNGGIRQMNNSLLTVDKNSDIYFAHAANSNIAKIASNGYQNNFAGGTKDAILIKYSSCASTSIGINESFNENSLTIYPNPTSNYININYASTFDKATVSIVNALGQTIDTKQFDNSEKMSFNVSSFAKGVYFVNAVIEEKIMSSKLIIE